MNLLRFAISFLKTKRSDLNNDKLWKTASYENDLLVLNLLKRGRQQVMRKMKGTEKKRQSTSYEKL